MVLHGQRGIRQNASIQLGGCDSWMGCHTRMIGDITGAPGGATIAASGIGALNDDGDAKDNLARKLNRFWHQLARSKLDVTDTLTAVRDAVHDNAHILNRALAEVILEELTEIALTQPG